MLKSLSTFVTTVAVAAATVVVIPAASAQAVGGGVGSVSLGAGATYAQNFDALLGSGTTNALAIEGWYLDEGTVVATANNGLYAAGTGSSTTGDTYSFGSTGAPADRAFGGLLSGSLTPTIGAQFVNNTGDTITDLAISYTGEMYRAGVTNRGAADRIDFQTSTDATSIITGTWTDHDLLDFSSPNTSVPAPGALDGNLAVNRTAISGSIAGLTISAGASFWIRWTDFNISSSDDGLAVDDFSITASQVVPEDTAPSVTSTVPADGATLPRDGDLSVTFSEPVNVTYPWFTLTCATSDTSGATSTGGPTTFTIDPGVTLTDGEACTLTVLAGQVSDQDGNDPPDIPTVNFVVGFTAVDVCSSTYTPIPAIQGSGALAAITGTVSTKGVVVGDFEGAAAASGFYIQDLDGDGDPATSDGIFVFTGSGNTVSPGQVVVVTGFARDRFNQTTLNGSDSNNDAVPAANIVQCGTGSVAATDVTLPVPTTTDLERYEGMLVRFPQPLVIAEYFNYDRFGEMVLAQPAAGETRPYTPTAVAEPGAAANARADLNVRSRITLDDVQSAQNPPVLRHPNGQPFSLANTFRGGDTVANTTGVLGYDFNLYRVLPTAPADYTAVNPRPAAPEPIDGDLRVAAMNTLNYFLTLDTTTNDTGPGPCGGNQNLDCRGADSNQPDEFARQRAKLLAALSGLDADVIGLNEVENTPGVEPLADIVAGLPGYAYIDTGAIGTDAIKVGIIYRPSVVTPVGAFQVLDSSDDPRFIDTKSRPALAQTFQDNATGGKFTVVVNHFKSKGSACLDVTPPDPDLGDGAGNCNVTRRNAAEALVDWLATDPTGSGDPDFLIMGDLNSYAMEEPIDQIKEGADDVAGTGDDYTNLIAQFLGADAYSYTFDGQAGYLDHALASASLAGQVQGATDWHINSDEPDVLDYDTSFKPDAQDALYEPNASRASDHDPVIVGIDVANAAPSVDAGGPYAVVEGQSVTLSATGADPEGSALTYAWDLNNDGSFETPGQSVSFAPRAKAPAVLTVRVRATDAFGKSATDTATVAIRYAFSGFFQPVDNLPVMNTVKAGRAVPVRFSLDGFHGLNIFAAGSPSVTFVPCGAGPTDAIEISLNLPGSFLIYNPFTDTYIYTWKTNRAWRGTCGELRLTFRDGTTQTALFRFLN